MSRNVGQFDNGRTVVVTSRKGRVSRNFKDLGEWVENDVTSRKGRVSRNDNMEWVGLSPAVVTSRKGRVSRNKNLESEFESL